MDLSPSWAVQSSSVNNIMKYKSCSFCGESILLEVKTKLVDDLGYAHYVHCMNCGSCGPVAFQDEKTKEETDEIAVLLWNNRV